MPSWIGPVTIGLGTVGLSTSRCEPAAGPLPFEPPSASAPPAVTSPTASAAATTTRPAERAEVSPVMRPLLWAGVRRRRALDDYVTTGRSPPNLYRRETPSHARLPACRSASWATTRFWAPPSG